MTWRRVGFWVLIGMAIPLVVVAAAGAYLGTRPDAWWRDRLTSYLSSTLDREVAVDGAFDFRLARNLGVEVEDLRIANPDWAESANLLTVGSLLVELDLYSVFAETLVVHRIEIDDVAVALERNAAGDANWTFRTEETAEPAEAPRLAGPREPFTLPVTVTALSVERAALTLTDPARAAPLWARLERLGGGIAATEAGFIEAAGELQALPFELTARLDTVTSLIEAGPVAYTIAGRVGEIRLDGAGAFDSAQRLAAPRLDIDFTGPDVTWLTDLVGAPTVAEGAFEAHVDVAPAAGGVRAALDGDFGTLAIDVSLDVDDLAAPDSVELGASLSGDDLAAFAELLGLPPLPGGPFEARTTVAHDAGVTRIETMTARVGEHRVGVAGTIGAWPALENTHLDVTAAGPDLDAFEATVATIRLGDLPAGAYRIEASIEPSAGGLTIPAATVTAGDYRATAAGTVATSPALRVELDVTGSGPDLSMVSRLAKILPLPALPFEGSGRLAIDSRSITLIGTSGTVGEHAAAADGSIAFSSRGPLRLDVSAEGPSLEAVLAGLGFDVIPADARYSVGGAVELDGERLRVTATNASLGPATGSATLTIPDLASPATLTIDVDDVATSDLSASLALVGAAVSLPRTVEARLRGTVRRTPGQTGLTAVRGTVDGIDVSVDGSVADPPGYAGSRLTLEVAGEDVSRFLEHDVDTPIALRVGGAVAFDGGSAEFEDFAIGLGNLAARVDGTLSGFDASAATELDVSVTAPSLDTIAAILDRPLPPGAVRFDGRVGGNSESIRTERMIAEVGPNRLDGELMLARGEPPRLTGRVSSSYVDLDFIRALAGPAASETAAAADGAPDAAVPAGNAAPPRLIPDTPIDLAFMDWLETDVELSVDRLDHVWEGEPVLELGASVRVAGDALAIADFHGRGPNGGELAGDFRLNRVDGAARVETRLNARALRVGVARAPDQDPATYPPTDVDAALTGEGRTIRELAASLDGHVKIVQGGGRISNIAFSALVSDILYELFELLNPFSKQEPTTGLECAVYIVEFADGEAEIQDFVLQTDKLAIVSSGVIDLETEALNVDFRTQPRKGIGVSASMLTNPWIRLGGTLARPALVLDPGRAAASTGAAVATGGISILAQGFWDRFFSSRDPCGRALERDAERQAETAAAQGDSR